MSKSRINGKDARHVAVVSGPPLDGLVQAARPATVGGRKMVAAGVVFQVSFECTCCVNVVLRGANPGVQATYLCNEHRAAESEVDEQLRAEVLAAAVGEWDQHRLRSLEQKRTKVTKS